MSCVHTSSEGSDEFAHLRRCVSAFVAHTKILEPNSVVETMNGIIHGDMGLSVARAFQHRNLAVWSCDQNAPYF